MKRRITGWSLAALLAVGAAVWAQPEFTDTEGHSREQDIEHAVSRGWFRGYDDGTFRPDEPISEPQLARVILRMRPGMTRGEAASFLRARDTQTSGGTLAVDVKAPKIRAAEVRMGIYPCCADLAFWQIPIELGWWDELNITIKPDQPTFHYFTASQEIVPWLQRGDGDVAQGWVPGVFGTLETFGQDIPPHPLHGHLRRLHDPGGSRQRGQDRVGVHG